MIGIGTQRHLFDIPADVAYFNCATMSPQLNASREALVAGARAKSHPWTRAARDYFADAETLRVLAADLFGGPADAWALIPSASYGVSAAARAIEPRLRPGDRILVIDEEFPANVLPWRRAAAETGAEMVTVPRPADGDWTAAVLARMDRRVKVASLSTVHWTNGAWLDVAALGAACRAVGAAYILDATQSLGAMPFPMAEAQPDFLVVAGYKWLLFPYGLCLMRVAEPWMDARPLEESWQSRANAEDFAQLVHYRDDYQPGARRFDVGEKGTALLPGAIAALRQIGAWGVEAIAETLRALNERLAEGLTRRGFAVVPPALRGPHILGAALPAGYAGNLVADLRDRGVHISQRGNALRFGPHLFVTGADLERLFGALDEVLSSARPRG